MRYCPQCRSEYTPDRKHCADCDILLVDELPPERPPHNWVEVFRGGAVQAGVVGGALESAGIETVTPDEYTSNLGWYAPSAEVRIMVPDEDAQEARDIVAGLHRIEGTPPELADAPEVPPAPPTTPPGLWTLLLRSISDTLIAFVVPLVATSPLAGKASEGQRFVAALLLEPSLLGMALWRRRRLTSTGTPILPVVQGAPQGKVGVGIVVGLLTSGLSLAYTRVFDLHPGPTPSPFPIDSHFLANTALTAAMSIGVAPLCEELFFRGALLSSFSAAGRSGWGVLVSSALFAVLHLSPTTMPLHFVLGCILAGLALSSHSVLAPMVAHAVYNAVITTRPLWSRAL